MRQANIAGIILFLIGLVLCGFPTFVYKTTEEWKTENALFPSRKYILVSRVVGGVFIAVGIFLVAGIIN